MKNITTKKLSDILNLHKKYVNGKKDGVRANLEGTNLEGANFENAYLNHTKIKNANFKGTNLRNIVFIESDFTGVANMQQSVKDKIFATLKIVRLL